MIEVMNVTSSFNLQILFLIHYLFELISWCSFIIEIDCLIVWFHHDAFQEKIYMYSVFTVISAQGATNQGGALITVNMVSLNQFCNVIVRTDFRIIWFIKYKIMILITYILSEKSLYSLQINSNYKEPGFLFPKPQGLGTIFLLTVCLNYSIKGMNSGGRENPPFKKKKHSDF